MLHNRPHYLERALRYRDTDAIKIITGIRRCGKTSLLKTLQKHLVKEGIEKSQILSLNFESKTVPIDNDNALYLHIQNNVHPNLRSYIFLDEIQLVPAWEKAVNAMRVDFDCDIYITGSNARLLSTEFSTLLSGRTDEIAMQPLVFSEYIAFLGYKASPVSTQLLIPIDSDGVTSDVLLFDDIFSQYLRHGGFPQIARYNLTQTEHQDYLTNLYKSIVTRDVLARTDALTNISDRRQTTIEILTEYLADTIGTSTNPNRIHTTLKQEGKTSPANNTIDNYLQALVNAYIFSPVHQYDIQGKQLLRESPKYYISDLGLRSYLSKYRVKDTGRIFENAVYNQLIYNGYDVHIGKLRSGEVDFIATKNGTRTYIQVTETMEEDATRKRELKPLLAIRDGYPKQIIVRSGNYPTDIDGIQIIPAHQFFMP